MAHPRFDLIVVGGGPAGLSTALHVAEQAPALAGRMLVLEKGRYPRDKYCAGAIGGRALRLLERIGVRIAVPSVAIHALSLRLAGESLTLHEPEAGIVVRRIEFDHALAREATRRNVEVREGADVERVEVDTRGARVLLATGEVLHARVVVGADGVAGAVRRSAGFSRGSLRAQVVELDTEVVPGDPPRDTIHFDFRYGDLNGYAWDFPTVVDGRPLMCRGVYRIVAHRGRDTGGVDSVRRKGTSAQLARFLEDKGIDPAGRRLKHFAERGFEPDQPISKPRVLLVGEAAGIDIATGEGIAQAIQYGALAARYLARALQCGDLGFSDWLPCVRSRELGWQLRQRLWFYERFYGRERDLMEKLAAGTPSGLRLGIQQFAGKSLTPSALTRAVFEATPRVARLGLRQVAAALTSRGDDEGRPGMRD